MASEQANQGAAAANPALQFLSPQMQAKLASIAHMSHLSVANMKDFTGEEVCAALDKLGFSVEPKELELATGGHISATYVTHKYAIKIRREKRERLYYANKLISDKLGENKEGLPVVKVLAYDFFEKTDYEILVMERAPGVALNKDIGSMSKEDIIKIFRDMCGFVKQLQKVTNPKFASICLPLDSENYMENILMEYLMIRHGLTAQKVFTEEYLSKVDAYFYQHLQVWADERQPVFCHPDVYTANIVHQGTKVTAIIDFDYASYAPPSISMIGLFLFIADPYANADPSTLGKDALTYLIPVLESEFSEIFADPNIWYKLSYYALFYLMMSAAKFGPDQCQKVVIEKLIPAEISGNVEETTFRKIFNLK